MEYFSILGLIINFMGSILIALSVITNPAGAHQMVKNKKVFFASINQKYFRWGVWLSVVGFVVQLVGVCLNRI